MNHTAKAQKPEAGEQVLAPGSVAEVKLTITPGDLARMRISWLAGPGRVVQIQATTNPTNFAWRNAGLPVPDGAYSELLPSKFLVPNNSTG